MSSKIIITVTNTKVVAEQINTAADYPIISREVVPWEKGNLSAAFHKSLENFSNVKKVRVMLSESLYHLTGFSVEKKHAGDRKYIKEKASDLLLEDLNIVSWDYAVTRIDGKHAYIQIFCVTKVFDNELRSLESSLEVDIEAILPTAVIVYDSFAEKDQSFILIYADDVSRVISIVNDGLLVFSTSFMLEDIKEKFDQVITYAQRYLDFTSTKVVFAGIKESSVMDKKSDFKAVSVDITAPLNLAEIKRLTGPDKKVLNLQLKKNVYSTVSDSINLAVEDETEEPIQEKAYLFFTGLLLLISIFGVGIGFFVIKFFKNI
jgi:hypothetical protein